MIYIMNGKELASDISEELKNEISLFSKRPALVVIQIGDDKASSIYVRNKSRKCDELGIKSYNYTFSKDVSYKDVADLIEYLNEDKDINGILVQQPVPLHLQGIEQLISPNKDVDGFTYKNLGKQVTNNKSFIPCTTLGILDLFNYYNIDIEGKHIVIIGRSNIVGKPTLLSTLNKNATVTICHSKTEHLKDFTRMADILIVAIGKSKFITSDYLSERCTCIIDVGINRDENNKLTGDCDFDDIVHYWEVLNKHGDETTRFITPVPGGVGPLTVISLMKNTVESFKNMQK